MWMEIVDREGKTIGAINSECCDLIRIADNNPHSGAFVRSATSTAPDGTGEVFKSRVSYLRLIETLTQSEAEGIKQLAEAVVITDEMKQDRAAPRIVLA